VIHKNTYMHKKEFKEQWNGPSETKTQSRELLGLFICVCIALCTTVAHNNAQNRPDNFPSYPPNNHHCSDDVYFREAIVKDKWHGILQASCLSNHVLKLWRKLTWTKEDHPPASSFLGPVTDSWGSFSFYAIQCHYPLLQASRQQITCPNYLKRFPFETVKRTESTWQPANEPKFSWKMPLKWCVHMWDVGMSEFKAPAAKELWKVRTNTQL